MATGTGSAKARAAREPLPQPWPPVVDWQYSHPILPEEVDEIITSLGYENNPRGNTAFGNLWGASEQTVRRWRNGRARVDHGGGFRLGVIRIAEALGRERQVKTIFNRHRPK